MTNKKILTLALCAALEICKIEEELHKELNNAASHKRVNDAWKDVQELRDLIKEENKSE